MAKDENKFNFPQLRLSPKQRDIFRRLGKQGAHLRPEVEKVIQWVRVMRLQLRVATSWLARQGVPSHRGTPPPTQAQTPAAIPAEEAPPKVKGEPPAAAEEATNRKNARL